MKQMFWWNASFVLGGTYYTLGWEIYLPPFFGDEKIRTTVIYLEDHPI